MSDGLFKILGILNLILSGFISLSYFFLLIFQKNCEFCSILVLPLVCYSLLTLSGYISLKTLAYNQKYRMPLSLVNLIGILASASYLVMSYLL